MSPLLFIWLVLSCKADFKSVISVWNRTIFSSLQTKKVANYKEWPCCHVILFALHNSRAKTPSLLWAVFPLTKAFSLRDLNVSFSSWADNCTRFLQRYCSNFPCFTCCLGTSPWGEWKLDVARFRAGPESAWKPEGLWDVIQALSPCSERDRSDLCVDTSSTLQSTSYWAQPCAFSQVLTPPPSAFCTSSWGKLMRVHHSFVPACITTFCSFKKRRERGCVAGPHPDRELATALAPGWSKKLRCSHHQEDLGTRGPKCLSKHQQRLKKGSTTVGMRYYSLYEWQKGYVTLCRYRGMRHYSEFSP